jgi:hypothetical protein
MSVSTPTLEPGYSPLLTGTTTSLEEREVSAEYGQVWVNGYYQQDITAFTGTGSIGQTSLGTAGSDGTVYRTTRKTRTGTMNYRKADSRWEALILTYMSLTPGDRRALRANGLSAFPQVQLLLVLDDPDSWGAEVLQLNTVRFWDIPIGYSGDGVIERSITATWEGEQLLVAINRPGNLQNAAAQSSYPNATGRTYQAFGGYPVF